MKIAALKKAVIGYLRFLVASFLASLCLTGLADNLQTGQQLGGLHFSSQPTESEISSSRVFGEPLIPIGGTPTPEENLALANALKSYASRTNLDDFTSLTSFVDAFPTSSWRGSLLLHLGIEYYNFGYYSKALTTWEQAWEELKPITSGEGKAQADYALGELVKMHSKLGHMDELEQLLDSVKGRSLTGPATQMIANGTDAIWLMKHHPEICFRCGPMALNSILTYHDPSKAGNPLIVQSSSTTNGFSLLEVFELSEKLGMNYQMAFRSPGAPLIVPSVLHWKENHYAALLDRNGDRYLVQDPTFYSSLLMTTTAIDDQSSGYFLVPAGTLPPGWRAVDESEASTVFGKGDVGGPGPGGPGQQGPHSPSGNPCGMTTYSFNIAFISLTLQDTPEGYAPPVGPPVRFTATYNQGEPNQPSTFSYSNLGQKWTCNWISYVTDNPSSPGANVSLYQSGGGTLYFSGFNSSTKAYAPELETQTILTMTSSSSYLLTFPDGSSELFSQSNGSTTSTREIFLTKLFDPAGNAIQLNYDSNLRITNIVDAIGQSTTLLYTNSQYPFAITSVQDPFGRTAYLQYNSSGLLSQITDVLGITSQYTYGGSDFITGLQTPYGITTFTNGQSNGNTWLTATDPLGATEMVEFNQSYEPESDPVSTIPHGIGILNTYLVYRNSFYWDKHAYEQGAGDYTKATLYHFCHDSLNESVESDIPESIKKPLENRVWYDYPGESSSIVNGTSSRPSAIGRVLDDGTTQASYYQYNAFGNVTNVTDPAGRNFTFIYASNNIDLTQIVMTRNGQHEVQGSMSYNLQHMPLTVTDTSGQITTNTYNAQGQILTTTDPKGEITGFSYNQNGYLLAVTGALQNASDVVNLTYDGFGRVQSTTDTEGYTLTYGYDVADRVTNITYPDGTFEQFVYSNLDLIASADRLGRWTTRLYNGDRLLTQIQDPLGRLTRFERCACGALTTLVDPEGRTTTWDYDVQTRPTAKHYADGSTITYVYENTTSRLASKFDEQGQETDYRYYPDDNLMQVSYPNAINSTPTVTYNYDPNYNRVITMQDGIGTTTYSYNPINSTPSLGAGQLSSVSGPLPSSTVTYQYDELGRNTNRVIDGVAQTTTFDVIGRPIVVNNALGKSQYSYVDATARLSSESYPNGQKMSYSYYDNKGDDRLLQVLDLYPNGSLLSGFGYAYNTVGQLTAWTNLWDTLPTRVWYPSYDSADQLTNVAVSGTGLDVVDYTYAYDQAGNRIVAATNGFGTEYFYNALNQLNGSSYALPSFTYGWDAADRLTLVNDGADSSRFSYDGMGRRVIDVEAVNGIPTSTNYYLWCGADLCEERNSTGAMVVRRFFPQGEEAVSALGSTNYFYTRDHLGSIREVVDASGELATRYDYDPYGKLVPIQEAFATRFGYAGYFHHFSSNLNLTLFRPYGSAVGRWLSRDPLGEYSDANLYTYAYNNPLNRVDPFGLVGIGVIGTGSGEGGVGIGSGATGSGGAGVFVGGSSGPSAGYFTSGGAVAIPVGGPSLTTTHGNPGQTPFVAGGYAGGGGGFFVSNANSVCDLGGPFNEYNGNVGAFGVGIGISFSYGFNQNGNLIWIVSATTGPDWSGFGASISGYPTTTTIRGNFGGKW